MLDSKKVKLAIAPIAWTNDDMPDLGKENTFEQCISEMALAGYTGSEVGNKYPKDPTVLKSYLEPRNLEIASAWFSSFLTTKPYEETKEAFIKHRDFLYEMGAKVIVVSEQGHSIQGQLDKAIFADKPIFNEEEFKQLCIGLNQLGELALEKDMKIVFHHHMGTGIQTKVEVDKLMANTDPNKVFLLFDSGHLAYSGDDYLGVLKEHIKRIKHVHLKDIREKIVAEVKADNKSFLDSVRLGAFTIPGDGCVDFKTIFDILDTNNYEGYMVVEAEQDPSLANPFIYALNARKYIKEMTNL